MELTEEQAAVVMAPADTNARIIAVPGSGKTTTVVHRVAYLVNELGVDPEKILCISFSQNAVNELKLRLSNILNTRRNVKISTYHGFAFDLLKKHKAKFFKNNNNISVLLGQDKENVIKDLFHDLFTVSNKEDQRKLFTMFMRFIEKRQVYKITTKESAEKEHALIRANFDFFEAGYRKYVKYLLDHNLVDFETMQSAALTLVVQDKEVQAEYIDKYEYYFVDEFQDTSWVQSMLLMQMIKNSKITIVGDADQNLYYWRGSDNKFILDFHKNIKVKDFLLSRNFRSTDSIIKAANAVIKKNVNRFNISIAENHVNSAPIIVHEHMTADQEADSIIASIKGLIMAGTPAGKIAVLFNINEVGTFLYNKLLATGIPAYFFGMIKFSDRKEIRQVLNAMKFVINPYDNEACTSLMTELPTMGIGELSKTSIELEAKRTGLTVWEVCNGVEVGDVRFKRHKAIVSFTQRVTVMRKCMERSGSFKMNLLRAIIKSGIIDKFRDDEARLSHIKILTSAMKNRVIDNSDDLMDFIIDVSCDYGLDAEEEQHIKDNAVHFMSIYKAKGLEYKHVFMIGNEMGIFPFENPDVAADYEDARRVFYVGLTRAQLGLEVHCSVFRPITWRYNKPSDKSMFVEELVTMPSNVVKFIQNLGR
jgi:DNA helicase-2/ATP-dependent DNA helicase PcrA